MKKSGFALAAVAASALFAVTPALAQAKLRAGTLTCTGGAGVGLVLGSQKTYSCKYVSASGRHSETYSASINKIGLDIGVTDKSTIVWAVLASVDELDERALAGSYVGATADAAIGIGGGANVLVGGSNNSVVLQPLSVQGQTGLNLAVGVAELTIR
ncbi:MAG: DUF992 domain-containing protein [Hyphomicrobium sp.]|uniref:DUF992 domain-containing protein n=1 Tax=Hyphomicrobium sp. TaxID=82 RepID=UPI003D109614